MKKITGVLVVAFVFALFVRGPVFAAAQPDLKPVMGDSTVNVSGDFTFVEYDNDGNFVMTFKASKLTTKDKKIRKLLLNRELLISGSDTTPTFCKENKNEIEFSMFGFGDKFEVSVKVNGSGRLEATKIRSLNFHCDTSKNTFPKNVVEGNSKEGLYHGKIGNFNLQKRTFDLFVTDDPYKVTAKKTVKVMLQNSPDAVFFVPKGKFADVKDGDNAYVMGLFNSKNRSIKASSIRIAKPLDY